MIHTHTITIFSMPALDHIKYSWLKLISNSIQTLIFIFKNLKSLLSIPITVLSVSTILESFLMEKYHNIPLLSWINLKYLWKNCSMKFLWNKVTYLIFKDFYFFILHTSKNIKLLKDNSSKKTESMWRLLIFLDWLLVLN